MSIAILAGVERGKRPALPVVVIVAADRVHYHAVKNSGVRFHPAAFSDNASLQHGVTHRACAVPKNAFLHHRSLFQNAAICQHGVFEEPRAFLYPAAISNDNRITDFI